MLNYFVGRSYERWLQDESMMSYRFPYLTVCAVMLASCGGSRRSERCEGFGFDRCLIVRTLAERTPDHPSSVQERSPVKRSWAQRRVLGATFTFNAPACV